ncbi:hypothetical protein AMK28_25015 [Streptomyces sp. CB02115]|nr:hypothetical protein AMK28_25015 [Streptomyces sp. CB02115]
MTLTGSSCPGRICSVTVSHRESPRGSPSARRRRNSTSVTTSVPAVSWCAPAGRRTAPTRSPRSYIHSRAAGSLPSRVNRDVISSVIPPGRVIASDLRTKWSWMLSLRSLL